MTGRVLVARLDNIGDVLLAGPAVRAVAAHADHVVLLAGPRGRAGAELLPGVDEIVEWCAPWIDPEPPALTEASVDALVKQIRDLRLDAAFVLTSFHQSPLPLALVLRLAGVPWIGAISDDYPGSLLDLRHRVDDALPEAERALSLAHAAGFPLPEGDDGALAVRHPLPDTRALTGPDPFVVVHPAASVPARQPTEERTAGIVAALVDAGHRVIVTGAPAERDLTARVTAEAAALLRTYFDDVAGRYYGRPAAEAELDEAMAADPSDAFSPPHGAFLMARRGDEPVGCVGLAPLSEGVLELGRMFVLPAVRGRGLGTRLLNAAEEIARGRGAPAIRLNTRHDLVEAQALYRAHGYAEIGAYTDAPYAEVFFEKRLR